MTSQRKTTDLERLTQPGGKPMPDDASIPVLTERLTLPSLDLDISLPNAPPPVVAGPPTELPPARAAAAPSFAPKPLVAPAPPIDWDAIEAALAERLLGELHPKVAAELERHVRERMQPALERAVSLLMAELRASMDTLVKDTVSRALAAEIARHRNAG
jgi:hypothetical protein